MPKDRSRRNTNHRARDFERSLAIEFTAAGVPSEWVDRKDDYGQSDTDVKVNGHGWLKIDAKTKLAWSHHTLFEQDVINRYCKKPGDRAVMPSKKKNQHGWYVCLDGKFFLELLLSHLRERQAGPVEKSLSSKAPVMEL